MRWLGVHRDGHWGSLHLYKRDEGGQQFNIEAPIYPSAPHFTEVLYTVTVPK